MKNELIEILGLNKKATEQQILAEVVELRAFKSGKFEHQKQMMVDMLKRDGIAQYDYEKQGMRYFMFVPKIREVKQYGIK